MPKLDWSNVPEEMRTHIVSEGQAYLDGQIRLATAADQRAAALAAVFTAAGSALIAGLIAFASVKSVVKPYPIYAGGGVPRGYVPVRSSTKRLVQ
jgi:hypothetical protein